MSGRFERMSGEVEKETRAGDPQLAIAGNLNRRSSARQEPAAASRTEGQLRFEVTELHARLAEVTRCLEAAENRAAEVTRCLEAAENRAAEMADARDGLEHLVSMMASSRSWRMTSPMRTLGMRLRSLFSG